MSPDNRPIVRLAVPSSINTTPAAMTSSPKKTSVFPISVISQSLFAYQLHPPERLNRAFVNVVHDPLPGVGLTVVNKIVVEDDITVFIFEYKRNVTVLDRSHTNRDRG